MRFLVVMVSAGAALALIAASALMNWVFMTSLGKSEFEQNILGAVSVAVSAFLALLPALLLWAWRERRFAFVALGVPAFLAFGAFSLSSAVGFAAKNRGSLSEDRALAAAALADVKRDIAETSGRLAGFKALKPVAVLQQSLRGLEQDKRWQSSKFCDEATADASRAFCKSYFELKAELAAAGEAGALEARLASLKTWMHELEERGAGREADNQAAVLAPSGWNRKKSNARSPSFWRSSSRWGRRWGCISQPDICARARVMDGEVLSDVRVAHRTIKQMAGPMPRRVPRLSRGR